MNKIYFTIYIIFIVMFKNLLNNLIMSSIKFIDLLNNIRSYIKSNKDIKGICYYDYYLHKLIFQLHTFDKNKTYTYHLREYYSDKYKDKSDEYDVIDNIVIFKNKFNTEKLTFLEKLMVDIFGTFDIINNSDPNEDIYHLGCRLFNVPGDLTIDEVNQIYCEI